MSAADMLLPLAVDERRRIPVRTCPRRTWCYHQPIDRDIRKSGRLSVRVRGGHSDLLPRVPVVYVYTIVRRALGMAVSKDRYECVSAADILISSNTIEAYWSQITTLSCVPTYSSCRIFQYWHLWWNH